MSEEWRRRLHALARRAGLQQVPDSVLIAAALLLVVLVVWGAWHWWPRGESGANGVSAAEAGVASSATRVDPTSSKDSTGRPGAGPTEVWVHVVGAVRRPGVYRLAQGARLQAAIDAAGGLLANASAEAINLARLVQDGEQVVVLTKAEFERLGGTASSAGAATGAAGTGSAAAAPGAAGPVDINTADAALLDTLPGIGPSTAAKIVADREANGPFGSVEDLGRVSGIGPKKLDALKGLICAR